MRIPYIFLLLVFISACGEPSAAYKSKDKSIILYDEIKEIVIWNNISQKNIEFHMNRLNISQKNIKEHSSNKYCKDINLNYSLVVNNKNIYTMNNFIACSNYDMKDTEYYGDKTYIITYGNLATSLGFPSIYSNFHFMFGSKPIEKVQLYIEKKYDIDSIAKDVNKHDYIRIIRNVSEVWFQDTLSQKSSVGNTSSVDNKRPINRPIYKIPSGENVTCDQFAFILNNNKSGFYKYYTHSIKNKECSDISAREQDGKDYGSDTYIFMLTRY